jgi:polysaccharide biosynthesis/export protein
LTPFPRITLLDVQPLVNVETDISQPEVVVGAVARRATCGHSESQSNRTLRMRRRMLVFGLAACTLAGCGGEGSDLPLLPSPDIAGYRLGAGDKVRIITFGEEQLTGEFRVNDSGMIALPLVGSVKAAGLTSAELETAVGEALVKAGLLRKPSVTSEIIEYRHIYVLGEVNKPGEYAYQPGMTVLGAVAVAGGFTYRAITGYVGIVRTQGGQATEGRAMRDGFVQPADVVTVYERRF